MKRIRCAIYTRKSSDEGLDQSFTSLDAQREACEAYIRSQKHEGWKVLSERFDDGGVSGGTMDRAALQRLLREIDAGRIDMIVVYKIDRLTRSLSDFAKLVDRLDAADASFVSVTQQFNTSTSMGRLTLNVLLSFAQFEREVTAERIRDKIAASKKKGLWLGGLPPLGYEKGETGLQINPAEADIVRSLFTAYLDLGCVRKLKAWADDKGLKTKRRCFQSGRQTGGVSFSRGSLYHLLSNPIYIGQIKHREELYDGQHDPIIDQATWDGVQQQLSSNRVIRKTRRNASHPSLLAGRIFGPDSKALTPAHSSKGKKRYRYYVSRDGALRLPAKELETAVKTAISTHGPLSLYCEQNALPEGEALKLIDLVQLADGELRISSDPKTNIPEFKMPYSKRKRGVEHKLVLDGPARRDPDLALIKRTVRAMDWAAALRAGRSISEIAQTESVSPEYITHNLGLAFLSPKILKAIVAGQQRPDVSVYRLSKVHIPVDWDHQDRLFLD